MAATHFGERQKVVPILARMWVVSLSALGVAAVGQDEFVAQSGVEQLTRGPIHEAFAVAPVTETAAGFEITVAPPDPIVELPPDQKPEGVNVAWIPGYWSWDEDRNDFIWLSGVWRDMPPNRQWIPGYWARVDRGYRWVTGFWADVSQTDVNYLPPPPRSLELGANSPEPTSGHLWTPGNWVWQQTNYAWQPGYWVPQQRDWVWCPAHYSWTPRGFVYVPGYWDHDISHRGLMFAPVYYSQPIYRQTNYRYTPSIVIDLAIIITDLFVQPQTRHYYFGDYYDSRYEKRGIYPWHSASYRRYGPDPNYVQFRSKQLQHDPHWDRRVNERFQYRREHAESRPPQTLAHQIDRIHSTRTPGVEHIIVGRSLSETVQNRTTPRGYTPVPMDERQRIATRGTEIYRLQSERARLEAPAADSAGVKRTREATRPVKIEFPVSPVASRPVDSAGSIKTPPVPVAPKPHAVDDRYSRQGRPQISESRRIVHGRPNRTTVRPPSRIERSRPQVDQQIAEPERKTSRPEPSITEVKSESKGSKSNPSRSGTRVQKKRGSGPENESDKQKKSDDQ